MHRTEIERKDLKIHFKDWSPVLPSNQYELIDDVDLMPVVRLLSVVSYEIKISNPSK